MSQDQLPVNRSHRDPRLVSFPGVPQGEDTQSLSFGPRDLEAPSLLIWLPVQAESRALAMNEETKLFQTTAKPWAQLKLLSVRAK